MGLDHDEIMQLHDKAWNRGQITRERAADDLVFYHVTQWDDNYLNDSQLQYKGEFNIIRKAGRQILADQNNLDVTPDFEPLGDTTQEDADTMDGLYRSAMLNNVSHEAIENASQECMVCGVGGWELRNIYEDPTKQEGEQSIICYPIHEFNNRVFFDPNAVLIDKSDAQYVSVLYRYSPDGYKALVEELTGEDGPLSDSFKNPEISYAFPWIQGQDTVVWVGRFHYREKKTVKFVTFQDPLGDRRTLEESEVEKQRDLLVEEGFEFVEEREEEKFKITQYIVDGRRILEEVELPWGVLPITVCYGERAYVEGEEYYEGVTRLAKDPQRLRNYQLSYLADIVSRSPRQKPMYTQEQIAGFEFMYEESGSENNYPYLLQKLRDAEGNALPLGPVGVLPEQKVPDSLILSMQESRNAVTDVANPAAPRDIMETEASGKALQAMQNMLSRQSVVYQDHMKFAARRCGEIFAAMAPFVYSTEREVNLLRADNTTSRVTLMETEFDEENLNLKRRRDVTQMRFHVVSKSRPAFQSQREQNRDQVKELLQTVPPDNPMFNILLNEYMMLTEGSDFKMLRNYARRDLIMKGVLPPETDEEKQMVAAAQQEQKPDPMMVAAQAEMLKAQADLLEQQNKQQQLQLEMAKIGLKNREIDIKDEETVSKIHVNESTALKNLAEIGNSGMQARASVLDRLRPNV